MQPFKTDGTRKYEAPLEAPLVDELFEFWTAAFGGTIDVTPGVLLGHEAPHTRIAVYVRRLEGRLAGACLVVNATQFPSLAGYGEVATNPEFRRRGIASKLSRLARDDFRALGGKAIFLGTGNPNTARIYFRLGWRKLAGANLMVNVLTGVSPEEFLVDHFRDLGVSTARAPSPADRVPMIPLLVSPHDWQVLDSNTGMYSTRYAVQDSCLGLYRRYNALAADGRGAWFCAGTDLGHVTGLATARLGPDDGCRVDAFTHRAHIASWPGLVGCSTNWAAANGASSIWTTVSVEDEEKSSLFESAGFRKSGPGQPMDLGGRPVETQRMELA